MEEQSIAQLAQAAAQSFPPTLEADTTLYREILAIDTEEYPVPPAVDWLSYRREPAAVEQRLWELLELLEENLGATYASVSRQLYHNSAPWRVNKWREMLTPGLVYVVYGPPRERAARAARSRGRSGKSPQLFLSFMLTRESGVAPDDADTWWTVVYLYEIQLRRLLCGRGLGSRLVAQHLATCARKARGAVEADEPFFGVMLTVFRTNEAALRFYRRLGMRRTAESLGEKRDGTMKEAAPLYYLYALRVE